MTLKSLLLAALIAAAPVSALAQPAPPPPHGMDRGKHMGERMFPSMSEAGRQSMREAMQAGGNRREERQKVEAARDRMLAALDAERFDAAAVRRAMDEERALADASRQQRQAAMLTALGKLSVEDRKAFVADSRALKSRMQARMDGWRDRMRERMQMRSLGQPPAPPTPPQPEL